MKTNPIIDSLRKYITPEVKRDVELSMYIAEWIIDVLEEKNMTQRQFASLLGKSESEISSWLCGTHVFTTTTIAKIETALGRVLIPTKRTKERVQTVVMKYNVIFSKETKSNNDNNWFDTSFSNMRSYASLSASKQTC